MKPVLRYAPMGDTPESEGRRPAKRIKLVSSPEQYRPDKYHHQQYHRNESQCYAEPGRRGRQDLEPRPQLSYYRPSQPFGGVSGPQLSHGLPGRLDTSRLFPPQAPRYPYIPATTMSLSSEVPASHFCKFSPTGATDDTHTSYLEPLFASPTSRRAPSTRTNASPAESPVSDYVPERTRTTTVSSSPVINPGPYISPFRDCIGAFGAGSSQYINCPSNGRVNGYVKFNWARDRRLKRPSAAHTPTSLDSSRVVELNDASGTVEEATSSGSSTALIGSTRASSSSPGALVGRFGADKFFSHPWAARSPSHSLTGYSLSPTTTNASFELVLTGSPRFIPQQFGFEAKMDHTDRQFWTFYIKNWCPGRSVLQETNLWLKDFAQMHRSDGVRSAIQSLAGIYIYDYMPLKTIRARVNERFLNAENRFSLLLNDPTTTDDPELADEFMTIAIILSMQDIVLTERRLRKPCIPRWLQCFRRGEEFLQRTDKGARFWNSVNAQPSSLHASQSIMVGRAVILAQPLSSLPSPFQFNAKREASRFGWLLYGSKKDMYEIHGGCGFSRRLMHIFSQITFCAARLQQDEETDVVPRTAKYIRNTLRDMRQWSAESVPWEPKKTMPPTIKWARAQPDEYKIDRSDLMTDVTAEAWRIAAILYLQCRVLRLPRNHRKVLVRLDDLAKCIKIMPTSGSHFTAQAPLFPVFLLGVLATDAEHMAVSETWFDEVLKTPVRSSVPPLFGALRRIWDWIDKEIPDSLGLSRMQRNADPFSFINKRRAWWEQLVMIVQAHEQEIPCLT